MGDVPAALAEFRTALEVNPRNATAHFNVGTILASQGWDEEAVSHFEQAIELKYTDSASHLELGRLLRRLGRRDEALEHLREAVNLEPRNESAWMAEAAALVDAERYKEAVERLEEGHRILPSAGHLAHALARLLAGSPDPELRDGKRALELASAVFAAQKTAQHAATVALALAELDRCDEASTWQQEVVRAATESGNESWATAERQALERYLAGPPCR
jgi:tetratricopeptide (TPR) repeat protein